MEKYDIIGDVHGCYDALRRLCDALGYDADFHHPDGRALVFVGDLINRGPESVRVLRLVSRLVSQGPGAAGAGQPRRRPEPLARGEAVERARAAWTRPSPRSRRGGQKTLKKAIAALYAQAALYWVLDGGTLIVAHAGIEEGMIGKTDPETRRFVLNGDAIGKSPEGKTLRRDWAADYHGAAFIVYGHTPQERAEVRGNTVNIDTGAYRGGLLTAFRWPERTLVSVPSRFRHHG